MSHYMSHYMSHPFPSKKDTHVTCHSLYLNKKYIFYLNEGCDMWHVYPFCLELGVTCSVTCSVTWVWHVQNEDYNEQNQVYCRNSISREQKTSLTLAWLPFFISTFDCKVLSLESSNTNSTLLWRNILKLINPLNWFWRFEKTKMLDLSCDQLDRSRSQQTCDIGEFWAQKVVF